METPLRPTRSFSLVLLSVVVLAASVFLISTSISMFTVTWDPCSLASGIIVLPLPVVLGIQQYRGTFRFVSKAAYKSSVLLLFSAGFALMIFATIVGEMIVRDIHIRTVPYLFSILAIAVIAGVSAWVNFSWSRRLKQHEMANDVVVHYSAPFSRREFLLAGSAVVCVTILVTYFVRITPPRYAENVSRDKVPFSLPTEATEISFCQGFRGTIACEFTIHEKGFVEWVESGIGSLESIGANIPLKQITKPYKIQRFNFLSPKLTGPDSITITNGLFYDWTKEDRGVYAAFDRNASRAYYFAHYH